jgi:hypothetical protein
VTQKPKSFILKREGLAVMNLNVEVGDEIEAVLKARAQAQGVTPDHIASQVLKDAFAGEISQSAEPSASAGQFWQEILDNMKDTPMEEYEKLPRDGASQVDHYLYGHPKR